MRRSVLTFDTTHHALWAEEVAVEAGIPHEIVPAPPEANARCNLAIETLPGVLDHFRRHLDEAGVPHAVHEPADG
jgi:hypothetical protein